MRNTFETIGRMIRAAIDIFYPLCSKYMSLQFFRYGVTGAANLLFDWVLYFFIYNFILQHRMLNLGFVTISSHIATFGFKFPIVFLSGFLLQKYVTFSVSYLRGHVQMFRYLVVFMINIVINYAGLKLLVDGLNVYPSISNIIISILTVFVSYFFQKKYTFKVSKKQLFNHKNQ